ncbi:hypothetical protein [Agaribacter flavus]|uniref:Lipoprotein n=1 Tax=Agaribacter flavus TaxID=1902781 RepID=A0ABV7FIW9_9ALTE
MKQLNLSLCVLISACASGIPEVETLSDNEYRITVIGKTTDGKLALEKRAYARARDICGADNFAFKLKGKGERIVYSGKPYSLSQTGLHERDTAVLEAVAVIECIDVAGDSKEGA